MFLTFDGLDGVGKTTQMALVRQWLESLGRGVVVCRDPGSTALGEAVRSLLLDRAELAISRPAEMLLYMAARAQLVQELISPALRSGKTVMSDRFLLANVVYQGHAGGLDVDTVWQVGQSATGGLEPDVTILLDMDPDAARTRLQRPLDRMELQGDEFRRRVRAGFLTEAAKQPERVHILNADRPVEAVHAEIRTIIEPWLTQH